MQQLQQGEVLQWLIGMQQYHRDSGRERESARERKRERKDKPAFQPTSSGLILQRPPHAIITPQHRPRSPRGLPDSACMMDSGSDIQLAGQARARLSLSGVHSASALKRSGEASPQLSGEQDRS
ncbi:hypothetical protein SRHO_G00224190 [Serrasalmus rhombeus]